MAFKQGKAVREGAGLSLLYYAPTTNLVAVPIGSREAPFIFEKVTADFQTVRVQGQVSYRIADPAKAAARLNFALKPDAVTYESDDPTRVPLRIVAAVEVLVQNIVQGTTLTEAIRGSAQLADGVTVGLKRHAEILSLGLEVLSVAVLAVKPSPETARALEAQAREGFLKVADDAVFARRNSAVEQERAIKESELDTEIAVEQKKRAIRETQMDAEASVRRKKHELRQADSKIVVLFFTGNGCPIARQCISKIRSLRSKFTKQGVIFWMVDSNLADDRQSIAQEAKEFGVGSIPILMDEKQALARALGIKRTAGQNT